MSSKRKASIQTIIKTLDLSFKYSIIIYIIKVKWEVAKKKKLKKTFKQIISKKKEANKSRLKIIEKSSIARICGKRLSL